MKFSISDLCLSAGKKLKGALNNGGIVRLVAAVLVFLVEMALLLWPGKWLAEEQVSALTGEGSWALEGDYSGMSVCQEFRPQHRDLKRLGFVITAGGQEPSGGTVKLILSDEENESLLEREIPYERIHFGAYTYVDTELELDPSKPYYLSLFLGPSDNGVQPQAGVCGREHFLPENQSLFWEEESDDMQMLTSYSYAGVISKGKILKALLLSICTALCLFFAMPEKKWLRRAVGFGVLLAIPYILGRRLELLTVTGEELLPFAMKWNMLILYFLELVLLLCTQSVKAAGLLSDILFTVAYSANYYVFSFRGTSLKINDLSAAGTAAQVMGGYKLKPNAHLAIAWGIALLFGILACKTGKIKETAGERSVKKTVLRCCSLAAGLGMAAAGGCLLLRTDFLPDKGFADQQGFYFQSNYEKNGYLVTTCIDIQHSRVEKPVDYSEKRVKELLKEYETQPGQTAAGDLPHIILIANESFSDLRVLGNLELSEENMGCFYGLKDNAVHGYVNVSVLGGGTANSEVEALMGCSMGFLPNSYYVYQQGISRNTDSVVSILKDQGYRTYSMHPESKYNWNRYSVYQYLGFDESFWEEDFEWAETFHRGASDRETYKKVEELYERREPGEPVFIFDLTMQNHGGYTWWGAEKECDVRGTNVNSAEAEVFLSLMKESDEAFGQLVDYFAKEEEKVIICMFGDHQPAFIETEFYDELYEATEGLTEEEILYDQYKTPFVIWANYDIEEQDGLDISLNYLGPLLLRTAGVEGSAYFNYLLQLMEEYPVITANGYRDSSGRTSSWSGKGTEFPDYRMLQYDLIFGSGHAR